ncbi:peptidase S8 [Paenibacillus nanensis]|uniref:Peptidase S8 n=1 Tax=Paenibacillus nanensis TaxID=393251 RepID=A0A3A1UXI6_9BACL|nr:S8 family serine peptidase [Paenibacillus nanensis]RIX51033.1 peptidase S8 [Paenibacillus nanensis]
MKNELKANLYISAERSKPVQHHTAAGADTPRRGRLAQRLVTRRGAGRSAQSPRAWLRRAGIALLIGSVALGAGGAAFAAKAPSPSPAPAAAPAAYAGGGAPGAEGAASEQPRSWLLKWGDPALAHELRGTQVIHRQSEAAVDVVRPAADAGEDVDAWLRRLRSEPGVQYVQENGAARILALPSVGKSAQTSAAPSGEVKSSAAAAANSEVGNEGAADAALKVNSATVTKPNDPELSKQQYLTQIGAHRAWETVREQKDIIIALVDTGIDLDHPDLKDNLVPGVNLVDPKKSPDDDNGHGTSVAGVIAAKGNNGIGVSGILWNAKLMPVKALDEWGDGTEQDLGEGIMYAVKNGAKVIVLSVGLHRSSPYMQDIVNYAENQGVLLIAASGNDGVTMGSKAAVKYPAAYPTVLAVGGAKSGGSPDERSNGGPELDLIAPWHVYTTAVGGTYKKEEGTSMAAPQAAAAAAMILARHPDFKPYQVRDLLRQTAKDIGTAGVDDSSGYGLLQIDRAVTAALKKDAFEPNNSAGEAKAFPLINQESAELENGTDQDWYEINVPYDGKLTLRYNAKLPSGAAAPVVRFSHYTGGKLQSSEETKLSSDTIELDVKKGKQLVQVMPVNTQMKSAVPYVLTSSFTMAPDAYEPNDLIGKAAKLEPKSGTVTGTFHKTADRDWFVVTFKQDGKLRVTLDANTARIDPGLSVQREDQALSLYDENGEGVSEQSPLLSVTPGTYYIRVHNAIALESSPTIGTYELKLDFTPDLTDPNEPNDKSYEALMMNAGTEYKGVMHTAADTDWFQFRLTSESIVSLNVAGVPANTTLKLEGYDKRMVRVFSKQTDAAGKLQTTEQALSPGVYYVKLTANKAFNSQYYRLNLKAETLVAGFRDIKGHWAQKEIESLSKQGIVSGIGSYRFMPERQITRAEAVTMIVNAYKPIGGSAIAKSFRDVSADHWANDAIRKAVKQGWAQGFPDGSFRPDEPVTRAEMAVLIGYAEGIAPRKASTRPFDDVSPYDWYSPMLSAMKAEGKLKGVKNNRFLPEEQASRAEFTSLLYRYYAE